MRQITILLFCFLCVNSFSQKDPLTLGELNFNYSTPVEYEIGPIRVIGADNYDHQGIKLIAGLRQGQKITLPSDQIRVAIRKLWDEGLFSNIAIYAEKEVAGVIYLVIELEPRPKLSRFKFIGISKREADKVREEIALFSGKTITENLVFQTKSKINGYFREKSFYGVSVDIKRIKDTMINESEIFIIQINKGERIGIKPLMISGNKSVPTWKLKLAMKDTKQKSILRIFKRSKFTESTYEKDKQAILGKFNAAGLRDATIIYDTVFKVDDKNLRIDIVINEGEKYLFGDIDWIGNSKYRSSFLDTVLGIKNGDVFNKELLDQRLKGNGDGRDISSLYMDKGYLFFQVIPVETNVTNNKISYQIRIIEGKEARIGEINLR